MLNCAILDLEWNDNILGGHECQFEECQIEECQLEEASGRVIRSLREERRPTRQRRQQQEQQQEQQRRRQHEQQEQQRRQESDTSSGRKVGKNRMLPAAGKEKGKRPRRKAKMLRAPLQLVHHHADSSLIRSYRLSVPSVGGDECSHTPTLESTVTKIGKETRRVHFDVRPPKVRLIDDSVWDDRDALWWSDEEQEGFLLREDIKALEYTGHLISRLLLDIWKYSEATGKVCGQTQQATLILSDSPARGMEPDLLAALGEARHAAVQGVLITQESLRHAEPNVRRLLVGKRYRFLSRTAVRFARLLAQGDEHFVKSVSFIEACPS